MIKNLAYVLIAGFGGYFIGSTIGVIAGTLFGIFLGMFFREIVYSQQTISMSILFALTLGGFLGWLAIVTSNKIYGHKGKPRFGILFGSVLGFMVILVYGVIVISDPNLFDHTFYIIPLQYGIVIGQYTGSIHYMVAGIIVSVREILMRRPTQKEKQGFQVYSAFYSEKIKK